MEDFRGQGPPADVGTFQFPSSILGFKYTFSGVTYVCAVRSGERGWVLVSYGVDARTVFQAAMDALTGGGVFYIRNFDYTIANAALTPNYDGITLQGENMQTTILRSPALAVHNIIERTVALPQIYFFTVRDLYIYGNGVAGNGIHISGTGTIDVSVMNVRVSYCYDGINSTSNDMSGYHVISEHNVNNGFVLTGSNSWLVICYAADNGNYGYYLNIAYAIMCNADLNQYEGFFLHHINQIIGGRCSNNWRVGGGVPREFSIDGDENIVTGMTIDGVGTQTYCIRLEATADNNIITHNSMINYTSYGIWNQGNANWIIDNRGGTLNDAGTNTKLATKVIPFGWGGSAEGAVAVSEFISATASAKGWRVDTSATDWAVALGQLPLELQQVVRIKVWAVALGSPLGAGGQMHVQLIINAGADNAAFNTEPVNLANFDSITTDYVANDVVYWSATATDDADIGHMVGGMSIEVKVIYQAGATPDGATNAVFRAVEIEYV